MDNRLTSIVHKPAREPAQLRESSVVRGRFERARLTQNAEFITIWLPTTLMKPSPFSCKREMRFPWAGRLPTPVTKLDASAGETHHSWPQFLPDGRHFLYLTGNPWAVFGATN
jgi:hypothetical protein